jgi:hypothetical protein
MTDKTFLRTEIGERVEQSDFQFATQDAPRQLLESVSTNLIVGDGATDTRPRNFVIHGFSTSATGTVVTTLGGKAMVGVRVGGVAESGFLLAGGDGSKNTDMNGRSDGTYGVYVRAEIQDDRFLNRLFWNPLALTPVETPRNIPTRKRENWSMTIELVSPGPEWLLVAQAAKAGSVVTITDLRQFFFEGAIANSYDVVDSEWGGGNDRNADRSTYGVKQFHLFVRAMQRQIQDILGGTATQGWWATIATVGGRSLKQLQAEKLARDGSQTMNGSIIPGTDNAYALGDVVGNQWQNIFFKGQIVGGVALFQATPGTNALVLFTGNLDLLGATSTITCGSHIVSNTGNLTMTLGSITCAGLIQNTGAAADIQAGRDVLATRHVVAANQVQATNDIVSASGNLRATVGGSTVAAASTAQKFTNSPVRTHYHWIGGSEFIIHRLGGGALGAPGQARNAAGANTNAHFEGPQVAYTTLSSIKFQDDDGSSYVVEIPIRLPDGVTVTAIDLSLNVVGLSVLPVKPIRIDMHTRTVTNLRSGSPAQVVDTSAYDSASSGLQNIVAVAPFVIDNSVNMYFIKIFYLGAGVNAGDLFGVRITYTMGDINGA